MGDVVVNNDLVQWLVTQGVGVLIAAVVFFIYRKDVRSYTELWQTSSMMLIEAINKSTTAAVENAATNREMIGLLRALHRRLDSDANEMRALHRRIDRAEQ